MSRSLRRGALAAALVLSIAPLAACAAGADSQTLRVEPNVVSTSSGDIAIQNALIITEPNGKGPASLTARVFNNGTSPQQLTGITIQGLPQQVRLTGTDGRTGPLTIPAGGSIGLGGPGNPSAIIPDASGLHEGSFQSVVFDLSSTGAVPLTPAVVPAVHYFTAYGPSVTASPSTTPTAPAGTPSSGTPSGSVSAPPSAPSGHPANPAGSTKPTASASRH